MTEIPCNELPSPVVIRSEPRVTPYAIERAVLHYISGQRLAGKLVDSAKFLVEVLIEGKITEPQLIPAQQALETSDNTLDRAILARLKTDGLDGEGGPLFPDLDRLYELLDRVQQASAA